MNILFGQEQLPVFLSFLALGVICGTILDLFRIKHKIFGSHFLILFFDDMIYTIICGALFIINSYTFNNGKLMWYEVPFLIIGFTVYRCTFSVIFIKFCFAIIDFVKKTIKKMFNPVKKLIIKLLKLIGVQCEKISFEINQHFMQKKIMKTPIFEP